MTVQSSRLSSTFPKKNPTAHSKGLSKTTARLWATTLPLSNAPRTDGPPPKGAPVNVDFNSFNVLNHRHALLARCLNPKPPFGQFFAGVLAAKIVKNLQLDVATEDELVNT